MPRHGPHNEAERTSSSATRPSRGRTPHHRLNQSEESWEEASSGSANWETTGEPSLPIGTATEANDDADMRSQTSRTSRTSHATSASGAPPRSRPRQGPRTPPTNSDLPDHPSGRPANPRPREAAQIAARTPSRRAKAAFQTLALERSHDLVFNMSFEIAARLTTFKWKQLLLMLRARAAVGERRWRRPCRWLAGLAAREVASLWGHLGASAQRLRGQDGPSLLR